jgi:hypothetical protein
MTADGQARRGPVPMSRANRKQAMLLLALVSIYLIATGPDGGPSVWVHVAVVSIVMGGTWLFMGRNVRAYERHQTRQREFTRAYCVEHGWDADAVTVEQARTIKAQSGWPEEAT